MVLIQLSRLIIFLSISSVFFGVHLLCCLDFRSADSAPRFQPVVSLWVQDFGVPRRFHPSCLPVGASGPCSRCPGCPLPPGSCSSGVRLSLPVSCCLCPAEHKPLNHPRASLAPAEGARVPQAPRSPSFSMLKGVWAGAPACFVHL